MKFERQKWNNVYAVLKRKSVKGLIHFTEYVATIHLVDLVDHEYHSFFMNNRFSFLDFLFLCKIHN